MLAGSRKGRRKDTTGSYDHPPDGVPTNPGKPLSMDTGVWLGIVGLGLSMTFASGAQAGADPSAQGVAGVPASRLARLATGANVCRWFRYPTATTDDFFANYLSDDEAAAMRRMGLRHVRLCVAPKVLMNPDTGMPMARELAFVDAAINRFVKNDLMVVVDIHNEERALVETPEGQAKFIKLWTALAQHWSKTNPEMVMLEIVNEPVFDGKEAEWSNLQERLVALIRAKAPRHTIVATGPNWGGIDGLRKIKPVADRNVVYSFHCYDPFAFTHQGATWSSDNVKPLRNVPYPSSPEAVAPLLPSLPADAQALLRQYGEERWNRERLAARFGQAIAWGKQHGVPLYCGEFGVFPPHSDPAARARWFNDFGSILSENGVGWASWGWDEGFGFNRQRENGRLVVDEVVVKSLGLKMP